MKVTDVMFDLSLPENNRSSNRAAHWWQRERYIMQKRQETKCQSKQKAGKRPLIKRIELD